MRPLVLASGSPQRKKLLRELGIPFEIVPSKIPEHTRELQPRRIVLDLALRKAKAVAGRRPGTLVLGADTIVWCAGTLFQKPVDKADARRILNHLNGRWHRVYTGVALVDADSGRAWTEVVVSRVKARKLSGEELERFAGKHLDKAGAYAVQDKDDPFIEAIKGPFDNVVGLPMLSVRRLLRRVAEKRPRKKAFSSGRRAARR